MHLDKGKLDSRRFTEVKDLSWMHELSMDALSISHGREALLPDPLHAGKLGMANGPHVGTGTVERRGGTILGIPLGALLPEAVWW